MAIHQVGATPLLRLSVVVIVDALDCGEDAYPFPGGGGQANMVQPVEACRGLKD